MKKLSTGASAFDELLADHAKELLAVNFDTDTRLTCLCYVLLFLSGAIIGKKCPEIDAPQSVDERLKSRKRLLILRDHISSNLAKIQASLDKDLNLLTAEIETQGEK